MGLTESDETMDFTFNFECSEDSNLSPEESTSSTNDLPSKPTHQENEFKNSIQTSYKVTTFHTEAILSKLCLKDLSLNNHMFRIVDTNAVEQLILTDPVFKDNVDDSSTLSNIISHSDLVEGVYEGGLKIWECGLDLANFISSDKDLSSHIKGKTVLELGCGAGIPGICCALCGAARVDFQDYNAEVLKLLTHPNVMNNVTGQTDSVVAKTECHYYAGDWSSFPELDGLKNVKYDVILSAETIYNVANYAKLHAVFERLLADNGLIFIAAKSYYFGVGGSVDAFIDYVENQKCFSIQIVHTITKGVLRKILQLKKLNVRVTNQVDGIISS